MKKQMSKALAFLLALSMVLALAACGGTDANNADTSNINGATGISVGGDGPSADEELADEQVFTFVLGSDPVTLDPWVNNSGTASLVINAIMEPLLRQGDTPDTWEPGLCTDYQVNEDATVHTLTLREGLKWSDGTDLTMDDIYNSVLRVLDPDLGSPVAYKYFSILNGEKYYYGEATAEELGVRVIDDTHIEFTTAEPAENFMNTLCTDQLAPIQKAAADEYFDLYGSDAEKVVCSGPFKITEWVSKNSITMVKNENYWDAENVKLEELNFIISEDNNTTMGLFQTGEASAFKVPSELLSQYMDDPTLTNNPRLQVTFIEFNPNNEFLANKNIREALSISFNRQLFAEQVMKNGKLAAYGLVPYGAKGLDGGDFREQAGAIVEDASDEAAIAHAQELLATGLEELGKTMEDLAEGFSIQCMPGGDDQAQAIQNMWKTNLGLEMPVQVLDISILLPMLMEGTFDCVIGGGQSANDPDPSSFLDFIYDEGKFDDPELNALYEKAHSTTGDERIQTYMDIEKFVLDQYIYIPQVYAENNWVFQPNVRGVDIRTYGAEFDFKNVYIVK